MANVGNTQLVVTGQPVPIPESPSVPLDQIDEKYFPVSNAPYRFKGLHVPFDENMNINWTYLNRAQPSLWSQRQVTPAVGGVFR